MQEVPQEQSVIHPWVAEGQHKVRAGVCFMGPCLDWQQYHERVLQAEELGFDAYWLADHPSIYSDCWTMLSALAVTTRRIRLGTMVDCIAYRNPVLLARMAADVDRLSGGRLILGLGIGDHALEFAKMGLPYASTKERQQALEDTIQVVKGVWGSTPFSYQTKHVHVEQCVLPAQPIQQPHVPLLIAGGGERVTLRQVAKYADASNFGEHPHTGGAATLADIERKFDVLRGYCEQEGRSAQAVLRTHITMVLTLGQTPEAVAQVMNQASPFTREMFRPSTIAVTPEQAIAYYQTLMQAGMQYFILVLWPHDTQTMALFSKYVMPALVG